jgi:hypothetical protein
MLRALLLLACTAKVAAFAQTPAGEAGCVDMDPDVIQSAFAEAIQDVEVEEGTPTITSCADVAANGGCADEGLAASCCASCALPQRMTYFGFSINWAAIMAAVARAACEARCSPDGDCCEWVTDRWDWPYDCRHPGSNCRGCWGWKSCDIA